MSTSRKPLVELSSNKLSSKGKRSYADDDLDEDQIGCKTPRMHDDLWDEEKDDIADDPITATLLDVGEVNNIVQLWIHNEIHSSDRSYMASQSRVLDHSSSRKALPLSLSAMQWYQRAQDFAFDWSKRKGISDHRIATIRSQELPQVIQQHGTSLLGRLVECMLNGSEFFLTSNDVRDHIGSKGKQNSINGIYIRFGIGTKADQIETSDDLQAFVDQRVTIRPKFFYIGESNDLYLRSLSHEVESNQILAKRYRLDQEVSTVILLPLVKLPSNDPLASKDESSDIRQSIEVILIAALHAYADSENYNSLHASSGLRSLNGSMLGMNGCAGTLLEKKPLKQVTSLNSTLQPLFKALLCEYAIMITYKQRLANLTKDQSDRIVHLRDRYQKHSDLFEKAKLAYKKEKGQLLLNGKFICLAHLELGKNKHIGYCLSGLFGIRLSGDDVAFILDHELYEDGFLQDKKRNDHDSFLIRLQLKDQDAGTDDYYCKAVPSNYSYVKGIKLFIIKGDKSFALTSCSGGPRLPLAIREDDRQYKSLRLMRFLIDVSSSNVARQKIIDDSPMPWWKRIASNNQSFLDICNHRIDAQALGNLSAAQMQLLDGTAKFSNRSEGAERERRVSCCISKDGNQTKIFSILTREFRRLNPQCEEHETVFVGIQLDRPNSGKVDLKCRIDNIASLQLPFNLSVWTRTTGWQDLCLVTIGGSALLTELVELAKLFKMPFHATSSTCVTGDLAESAADAPQWIDSIRKIIAVGVKTHTYTRIGISFRKQVRESLQAKADYGIAFPQELLSEMRLEAGDKVKVHIDFWTRTDPNEYRILVSRLDSDVWYTLWPTESLKTILLRARQL